jgi:hypothetical protein
MLNKPEEYYISIIEDIRRKVIDISAAYSKLQEENVRLRSEKFKRFNNEECWIYDETGDNHLESLVCPVVISASTLSELLKRKSECVK